MLAALSIRNIVLIEQLDLDFTTGLTALTGETGAGKSILMDSLGLALGARGDARLVREGADKGQVTAIFELPLDHGVFAFLSKNELEADDQLVLRRVQNNDGRTRSFINDVPVSLALLRELGQKLVEIHGQHDDRALLDITTHRSLLDAHAGLGRELGQIAKSFEQMKAARRAFDDHCKGIELIRERAGYLTHVLEELRDLDPRPNEEEELAGRRQMMMSAEKIAKDLTSAEKTLSERGGLKGLATILRKLERQPAGARELLDPVTSAIEKVLLEVSETRAEIYNALSRTRFAASDLDEAEQRLFALREAARKYKVPVVMLPEMYDKIKGELAALDANEEQLAALREAVEKTLEDYTTKADELSKKRVKAANRLDKVVEKELGPLKLEKARFITKVVSDPENGGASGYDKVVFHVRTNPGSKPGPLLQVASGGELSRFILALKVVLAANGAAPVLVFDEIDKGVGGATATAIGERLLRLSQGLQVFAITHAPQIAALADGQMKIAKNIEKVGGKEKTVTTVSSLSVKQRREEIARMLAGSTVTSEARAAADRLIRNEV
ncbi:MAG: DNA repair protein RecN [Hyphomicrobiaceae bacterium]|nr:DNA repair protein RecN [Hyphomicrobiaceae bacterium]